MSTSTRPTTRAAAAENSAARRAGLGLVLDEELRCPECGATRRTPETLRVHRWLAHDVKAAA